MIKLTDVVEFLDTYLDIKNVKDDSWNGLQVEGSQEVNKIMFAVDAGMQTFERAVQEKANMVVVHHGHFWKPGDPRLVGFNKKRMEFLLKHNISLYASHLPLDKHAEVGNNAQLIKILGFEKSGPFCVYSGETISFTGKTDKPKTLDEIENILKTELGAECKVLPFGPKEIKTMAVCSGGGGYPQMIEAMQADVDFYLTGDSTEMYHYIKDAGINVIFAGHHATEIVGVKALAQVVKDKLNIETLFVDIPTGL
jgi:dinuclear metal center YbgI/SA1388 family protein